MAKRKSKGRNLPVPPRNYAYEGRNNRKREKKKISGYASLQAVQPAQTGT
ncbi:hypothetical protein [Hyphomicrobium facile]|uniref:Uncharacterized protein n=1 Tax=Hyphomicrobium facile TaxID=51670 RepID=A0A1I7NEN0_9HYPH|nr:hypothetical protein [Hyphomicrobium facile]SFV33137.1 hypothetical protein SAMN04488557_1850 [Hyphomicrobium facile]